MSGAPIILPFRHAINIVLALALVFFIVGLVMSGSALDFWLITIIALVFASINIFGGFLVTSRMLAMYQKKTK